MKVYIRSLPVLAGLVLILTIAGAAFAFQAGPFKPQGLGASRNPLFKPVFEGGGGPTREGVDVNSPMIGDCSASDSQGEYKVSTCLPSVNDQLKLMAENYVTALKLMAAQMTGVIGQQIMIVGSYFDADEQLDTQRDFQTLTVRAQKDYHPSEQLCAYGSGIRSLANTEERGRMNHQALNAILIKEYSNNLNTVAARGSVLDTLDRIQKFKDLYCDPRDHNNLLWELCFGQAAEGGNPPQGATMSPERLLRVNKDIDYHRTLYDPRTLDVDFTNTAITGDEQDVIALARNLYWDQAIGPAILEAGKLDPLGYMALRSLIAKGSLAHNSFTSIVGMKSKAPPQPDPEREIRTGGAHLKAILRDFNIPPGDIEKMFGQNPSYFSQMEILSKTIYQHPNFYTNLYDKPANIARINAAMTAIRLMQLRDRFDSQTRRELLMAALMENSLKAEEDKVYSAIQALVSARR